MPRPATRQMPSAIMRDLGAQRAHGGGGAQHVLPGQQAGDAGLADRQRAEHQRAMADRLVARHGDPAVQRAWRPGGNKRAWGSFVHGGSGLWHEIVA